MLILTRRTNEAVNIGDDVIVKVLRVDPNRVRIGIIAPDDVRVDREEIRKAKNEGHPPPTKP